MSLSYYRKWTTYRYFETNLLFPDKILLYKKENISKVFLTVNPLTRALSTVIISMGIRYDYLFWNVFYSTYKANNKEDEYLRCYIRHLRI